MNGSEICLLLCCIALIGPALSSERTTPSATLYRPTNETSTNTGLSDGDNSSVSTTVEVPFVESSSVTTATHPTETTTLYTSSTPDPNTPSTTNAGPSAWPPPTGPPSPCPSAECLFSKKQGTILLMVTGGLLLLCTLLFVTCVVLSCQVCHLKRRHHGSYRPARSNADLLSSMSYLGTAQRNKEAAAAKAEGAEEEPTKTSMLMEELRQSQAGETGNGAQEGGTEDKKEETDKETFKDREEEEKKKGEAKANGCQGKAEGAGNGSAGSAKTKEGSSGSTKEPAESTDPAATAAPSSEAPGDVVVVVV